MNCFLCDIELHQRISDRRRAEPSYPVCGHPGKRICQACESAFQRNPLPKKAVGILAANPRGRIYDRLSSTPPPKNERNPVWNGKRELTVGGVQITATFTPAKT